MKDLKRLDLNKKKLIIFDMDGTLIDSIGIWNVTDYEMIKQLSGTEIPLTTIQQERDYFLEHNTGEDSYLAYCKYLKDKYHCLKNEEEVLALRWKISQTALREVIDYKEDADKLLKELKKRGKNLALATVTTKVQLDIYENENKNIIKKANLRDVFDFIISKEDLLHKKPHPEIYQKVLEYFQISPEFCLVFEDSYLGVLAAKNAGIEVVNIFDQYANVDREKINDISDYRINAYNEILELLK